MQVVIGQFNELHPNAFKGDPVRLEGGEVEVNGTMVTVPPAWQASNAVFRVGVGTGESDRKDAVTVYKDGTVVIPGLTYTPNLRMGRDNKYGIPIPGLPPTMPPTAVGTVAAIGVNNTVVARASTAIGNENFAIGWASLATGYKTSSVGEFATSSGVSTVAEGVASVSMGYNTKAQSFAEAPPPSCRAA